VGGWVVGLVVGWLIWIGKNGGCFRIIYKKEWAVLLAAFSFILSFRKLFSLFEHPLYGLYLGIFCCFFTDYTCG